MLTTPAHVVLNSELVMTNRRAVSPIKSLHRFFGTYDLREKKDPGKVAHAHRTE